jgi:hypothetical protein
LLPAKEKVCSISISDGLLSKIGQGEQESWIVNAKELVFVTQSAIPSSRIEIADIQEKSLLDISNRNTEIGIRPMGVTSKDFEATYKVSISRVTDKTLGKKELVNKDFKYKPIYKNVPSAVWKASTGSLPYLPPGPNEEKLIEKALSGFEIQPREKAAHDAPQQIDYEKLLSDRSDGSQYFWSHIYTPRFYESGDVKSKNAVRANDTIKKLGQALEDKTNYQRRQNLLNSLKLKCNQNDITISKSFAEDLLDHPSLVSIL